MGRSCGTCGGDGRSMRFWCGNLRGKVSLKHLGINGRIILK